MKNNEKKDLRAFYKNQLNQLTASAKKEKQKEIVRLLKLLPFFEKAKFIAGFKALPDEPCLNGFYNLHKDKMCFPVLSQTSLLFYKPTSGYQKNIFSVWEPRPKHEDQAPLCSIDVYLIPARAFDRKGRRLGRGGGFYDKSLAFIGKKTRFFSQEGAFPLDEKAGPHQDDKNETSLASAKANPRVFHHKNKRARAPGGKTPHSASKALSRRNSPVLLLGIAFAEQIHHEDLPFAGHDLTMDGIVTDRFALAPLIRERMKNGQSS